MRLPAVEGEATSDLFVGMSEPLSNHWLRRRDATAPARHGGGKVALILVQVRDDQVEVAKETLSQVVESIMAADGTVFHVVSALVIGTFDFGVTDWAGAERRCEAAAHSVQGKLRERVKVLYGMCDAIYGNFGTPTRIQHGPFIKGLEGLLERLRDLDFGAAQKV